MPSPVLGGATLLMFGSVAAAGIRILHQSKMDRGDMLVVSVALAAGIGVELEPQILEHLSDTLKNLFISGITTGALFAILASIIARITGHFLKAIRK